MVGDMYEHILYEANDPVATITLNRPTALNAWTPTMDREIRDALGNAAADRSIVGIVITGAGRAFCAGADMNALNSLSSGAGAATDAGTDADTNADTNSRTDAADDFSGRFPYMMRIDKPIIAAINGAVAGMAFPFALCCDIRVVTPDAVFLTAFAQRGLIAE